MIEARGDGARDGGHFLAAGDAEDDQRLLARHELLEGSRDGFERAGRMADVDPQFGVLGDLLQAPRPCCLPQRAEHGDVPLGILFRLEAKPDLSRAQRRNGVVDLVPAREFQLHEMICFGRRGGEAVGEACALGMVGDGTEAAARQCRQCRLA